jgi:hypothetical protein
MQRDLRVYTVLRNSLLFRIPNIHHCHQAGERNINKVVIQVKKVMGL